MPEMSTEARTNGDAERADERLPGGRVAAGLIAAVVAVAASAWMWNFTVDDALISVRYAQHIRGGVGYRFNADGPMTDGVTPLPWAFVLAALADGDALEVLFRAKVLGAASFVLSMAVLGATAMSVLGRKTRARLLGAAGLAVVGISIPVAAWSASGMETGLAMALATLAACLLCSRPSSVASALVAGLATSLRPELLPWAIAIAVGAGAMAAEPSRGTPEWTGALTRSLLGRLVCAALPFFACVLARVVVFGRMTPLALLAKPSDLSHGLTYGAAAILVALVPLLCLSRTALLHGPAWARVLSLAYLVHWSTVIMVGGDWMPYARLLAPVTPSLLLVFAAAVARDERGVASALRLIVALVLGGLLAVRAAPAGRHVGPERAALVTAARPMLEGARVVAALDIGWVSAATSARIVDLAGLTDPQIAVLPGGHTSKRVSPAMLLEREVDTVLVYSEPRVVEARLTDAALFRASFEEVGRLPLGPAGAPRAFYTVYRRSRP